MVYDHYRQLITLIFLTTNTVAIMSATLLVAIATVGVFYMIKFLLAVKKYRRFCDLVKKFPQDPSHPFWGHLFQYPGLYDNGMKYQPEVVAKYPRVSIIWCGPFLPFILVYHPDTVERVIKMSVAKSQYAYSLLKPWIGDGLVTSQGPKWARNRHLLTTAFHSDLLKSYLGIKNKAADILLARLGDYARRDEYFEVYSTIKKFSFDVILKCAFSYDADCQREGDPHYYVQAVQSLSEMVSIRVLKPWLQSDFIYSLTAAGRKFFKTCRLVHKVADDVIRKRKQLLTDLSEKDHTTKKKKCLDFLDILLTAKDENGEGLTSEEIRDEVDTFLAAGEGTTASTISWTMYSLAQHPDIQATCQEEIDELFKGRETDEVLWEDLSRLPYLSMCIKEGLRLHSPIPFIYRQLSQDLELDGFIAPKGVIVCIALYNIHHNPKVWEDSLEFRPERFTEENMKSRSPYAFIPFSAGKRNCIGQNFAMEQIKLALARILHRFTLVLDPDHKVEKVEHITMSTKTGIKMKAIPRKPV